MSLPIGVFDSGLGGLTVLRALRDQFPRQQFIYLGDTARLPYGNKSPGTLKKFVEQNMRWMERRGVMAVVVACNSASTVLEHTKGMPFPVFDVIGPSADAGVAATKKGVVAVMATRATVNSNAYGHAIQKIAPSISVVQVPCPLLVPLVEEGWVDDPVTRGVLHRYLDPVMNSAVSPDTLILGCTHFPVLKSVIAEIVGPGVTIVESGPAVASRLIPLLGSDLATRNPKAAVVERAQPQIFVTDLSPQFHPLSQSILGGLQGIEIQVTFVDED